MATPEEEAVKSAAGLATAAFVGLRAIIRPVLVGKIREVLERNSGIVDQRPEALDHLADELADTVLPPMPETGL